jgi:O-antigen ligase
MKTIAPASKLLTGLGSSLAIFWAFLVSLDPIFIFDYGRSSPSHFVALPLIFIAILWFAHKRTEPRVLFLLFAVLVLLGLGLLKSVDPMISIRRTIIILYYMAILLAAYSLLSARPERIGIFLLAMVFGVLLSSIYGWWLHYEPPMRLTVSPGYNPTWLGAGLAVTILILFSFALRSRSLLLRTLLAGSIAFSVYLLILTQAQTALYSLIGAAVVWAALRMRRDPKAVIAIIVALSLAVVLVMSTDVVEDAPRVQRTMDLFESEEVGGEDFDRVTAGRTAIWRDFLGMENLSIVGVGWGNAVALSSYNKTPHNNYITVLIESGILGIIVFLWLMLRAWFFVRGRPLSMLAFLFFSIFMFGNDMIHYKYAWLAIMMILMLTRLERPSQVAGTSMVRHRGYYPGEAADTRLLK